MKINLKLMTGKDITVSIHMKLMISFSPFEIDTRSRKINAIDRTILVTELRASHNKDFDLSFLERINFAINNTVKETICITEYTRVNQSSVGN